jgi:hypothetical protein
MNVDSRIFGTHKPLLTQTGFDLQLLETYKINLNNIGILYREPSKDASYQVLIHLAKRFQRRIFFRNQPIRNKNCL